MKDDPDISVKNDDQLYGNTQNHETDKFDSRRRVFSRDKKIEHRLLKLAIANVILFLVCWCDILLTRQSAAATNRTRQTQINLGK